jgi:hypothetical protein
MTCWIACLPSLLRFVRQTNDRNIRGHCITCAPLSNAASKKPFGVNWQGLSISDFRSQIFATLNFYEMTINFIAGPAVLDQ